jgi:predicted porin
MGERTVNTVYKKGRWLTLTAASALLMGAGFAGGANAADLGGGCCGDLEERIAELEATTARKGNRVVSLEISGQINRALLIWDDGVESDAYVVDPDSDGSRIRFTGKAKLKPGWEAGYTMEMTMVDTASNQVNQDDNGDDPIQDILRIRRNFLYIESERLGRISLGQENQATDGINEIDVVTTYSTVSKTHYAGAFRIRTGDADTDGLFRWQDVLGAIGGTQEDIVRYDTPSIFGFIASASWGDDDVWDVALRFQKQWNSVKIAAGIGYLKDDRDDDLTIVDSQISGSISAIHLPTGLFATFAAGSRDQRDTDEDATNLYFKGGISRRWLSYGDTTLWADYAKFEGFGEGLEFAFEGEEAIRLTSSEADVWGFGVVQSFDSAALNVYALAQFFSTDLETDGAGLDTEDHFAIVIGSHIKF